MSIPSDSFTDAVSHPHEHHEHQLPNEIIEEVVDHLKNNTKALKAISLSSRIFLHRARKHLFSTLVLQVQNTVKKDTSSLPSRKIFRLIKSAPHLIPYIQVLEIAGNATRLKVDRELSKALGLFQQTLETEILTPSLRHLYLYNIVWSDLSIDIRAAIQRFLGFSSLKMVTFYITFNVPWTVFKEISSNVTALTLESACFWPEPEETDDEWCEDDIDPRRGPTQAPLTKESGIDRLRIEALCIAHDTLGNDPTIIFAHDSVCPLNLTHLRTFWVHVESYYWWIRHQEFISHISCSLETLGINFSSFSGITLPSLDCCQLHNLKHLHVHTSYKLDRHFALQSAFLWLCESLETLPRRHQLQSIIIRCVTGVAECIDYQSKRGSWPEVKKGLGWEHIDMFLTQPKFDSLRQIRICLGLGSMVKRAECSAVLRSAPVLLPRVMAKGIVVLDNYKEEHRPPY